MPARFESLGNDRVDSALLEPSRFFDRGRAADDCRAGRFRAPQKWLFRQAEVKADHFRLELLDDFARRFVERQAQGRGWRLGESKLLEVGFEQGAPSAVIHGFRHGMTE